MLRTLHQRKRRKKLKSRARISRPSTSPWQNKQPNRDKHLWRRFPTSPIVLGGIWPINHRLMSPFTLLEHRPCHHLLLQHHLRFLRFHKMPQVPRHRKWTLIISPAVLSFPPPRAQLGTRTLFRSYQTHLDLLTRIELHQMPSNPSPLPRVHLSPDPTQLHSTTHQLPVLIFRLQQLPQLDRLHLLPL